MHADYFCDITMYVHVGIPRQDASFKVLGQFSIIYFRGLGLRIGARVRVRVRVGVRVRVMVMVRVSVVLWSG